MNLKMMKRLVPAVSRKQQHTCLLPTLGNRGSNLLYRTHASMPTMQLMGDPPLGATGGEAAEASSQTSLSRKRMVDLRSDTVTKPTAEMTIAMMDAEVGDDVYHEDPTVNKLEKRAAEVFGKESALFVPSGTMGNLCSIGALTSQRGEEMLIGDLSHMYHYEQGGAAFLLGVNSFAIRTEPDGTLKLQDLQDSIKEPDPHYAKTTVVCLENTHNKCGGTVLPKAYIDDVAALCKEEGLKLHMDGARIFNASTELGINVSSLVENCDTVSACLSKGLGAPVGSVVAGSKEVVDRAHRLRKALGGGMRQAGIMAAPAYVALEKGPDGLKQDHQNARYFARCVDPVPGISVRGKVASNMVFLTLEQETLGVSSADFANSLESEFGVQTGPVGKNVLRFVWHHQVSSEQTEKAIDAVTSLANRLGKKE
eukprot:gb/GECG01001866.1/.p1 GENE.gb/GECG01001866.1/~~gb/GECG01001866.1/.p1  ORF type:complete len:424 (+),score=65.06 gb/GECG01001866.1/:1-1272(+)